jgi:gamma-glutamyltranspeptidase/glutathione hydrolase
MLRALPILGLSLASAASFAQGFNPTPFSKGCVASDSLIASQVGAQILKKGGNAVDAAIAVQFALAVTLPQAGNLGGGGFMVVRMADGRAVAIDYREMAPLRATRDMFVNGEGQVAAGRSITGYLAAGIPGTVAGMGEAHRRFGKLKWADLVEPARKLAAVGFAMPNGLADDLKQEGRFKQFPASYSQFQRNGRFYSARELFKQPDLAGTLQRIKEQGWTEFYQGKTAELINADMNRNGGLIGKADLAGYAVKVRQPIFGAYRGHEIITMPPPSSGGIALTQMLMMLESEGLGKMGFGSARYAHTLAEVMKRAFAVRSEFMGDPDFVEIPRAKLLDPAYVAELKSTIKPDVATPAQDIKVKEGSLQEGQHTTHFSVIDQWGNAVANTTTINTGFGAAAVVKGAGFLLNNEMDDFTSKVGVPNVYGLIQGENNAIAPGKRPLSSMTPTIVVKNGQPVLILGSPGGPTIINTVLQTILNVLDHGMSVQRAVAAPRLHHQWLPDELRMEAMGLSPDTVALLEKMGHKFSRARGEMGSCHAIAIGPAGVRLAGIDPRLPDSGAAGH